jgi:hypothetical protein
MATNRIPSISGKYLLEDVILLSPENKKSFLNIGY